MPRKIVVGITQSVNKVESYGEWRDTLDQRLVDWVVQSGFVPVPIPNTLFDIALPNSSQLILENWLNTVKIDEIYYLEEMILAMLSREI